ncbi:hypothetical protein BJ508DRAFT_303973 [Ascobolus immersus RN42]|uniref:Uncharacterized protein n=1 Tax=Ascobolus immersus RN42 TaxID=1160509 RepID=A0A3N4IRC7_ASCIM|nr:hypothetical protein BJ508DRAFT_303973 [Ascobolus immersus RN42]
MASTARNPRTNTPIRRPWNPTDVLPPQPSLSRVPSFPSRKPATPLPEQTPRPRAESPKTSSKRKVREWLKSLDTSEYAKKIKTEVEVERDNVISTEANTVEGAFYSDKADQIIAQLQSSQQNDETGEIEIKTDELEAIMKDIEELYAGWKDAGLDKCLGHSEMRAVEKAERLLAEIREGFKDGWSEEAPWIAFLKSEYDVLFGYLEIIRRGCEEVGLVEGQSYGQEDGETE